MNDDRNFEGYRLELSYLGDDMEARIKSPKDVPANQKKYDWGTLYYKFTPFDIIYAAVDNENKPLARGTEEFPIKGEKSMSEHNEDPNDNTTGHVWDGIKELKNKAYFSQVDVMFGAVTWPHEQDIAPETLLAGLKPLEGNNAEQGA